MLYVVDRNLPGVWKIVDGQAEVFYQGPKQFRQPLNAPRCIALHQGRVLVGDSAARNVFWVTADQPPVALSEEPIGIPMALAVGPAGQLYVADLELHQVLVIDGAAEGPSPAKKLADIRAPRGLAVDAAGEVWVATGTQQPIRRIATDGTVSVVVGESKFKYPAGIAVLPDGTVVVSDSYDKSVSKVAADGVITPWVQGKPWVHPVALTVAGDSVLVADSRGGAIRSIDSAGQVKTLYPAAE